MVLSSLRGRIAFALVAVAAVVGTAVGVVLAFSGGGKSASTGTTSVTGGQQGKQISHQAYLLLYAHAVLGKTPISVVSQWPAPYQIYKDGTQAQCYEWYERPPRPNTNGALFDLCFKKGILVSKTTS
jgi:hypothetical protein